MKQPIRHLSLITSALLILGCSKTNDEKPASFTPTPSDTTFPILLTNLTKEQNSVVHRSKLTLEGNVSDDIGIQDIFMTLNGNIINVNISDGNFSAILSLKAGENNCTITATDRSGNTTSVSTLIYLGYTTAAGGSHSGALQNGNLYTWGRNNFGQTGLGYTSELDNNSSNIHPNTPLRVNLPNGFSPVSLSFNQNYSVALDKDGTVWSWGYNKYGELGRGESTDMCSETATTPDCILNIGKIDELVDIVAIEAGYSHTLALKRDGSVWGFGTNSDGELGRGDTNTTITPIQTVWDLNQSVTAVMVSAGSDFSCAIDDVGRLWAWGKNNYGQMGQGTKGSVDQLTPIQVPFPQNVKIISVATGMAHVLALDTDGTVWGWGLNASSQVGYYGYQYKETPEAWERYILSPKIVLESNTSNPVVEIFANGNSSYILRANQKIYPWGQYGETDANGTTTYANLDYPEDKLTAITSIKDVAAGALHLVAVKNNNTIFTWRWSFEGSLGGGESTLNQWMYNYPIVPVFPQ